MVEYRADCEPARGEWGAGQETSVAARLLRTVDLEVDGMTAVSATTARPNLYRLIDQVNDESEPLTITGRLGSAVLIGEEDCGLSSRHCS
jgi:prevent-host-death family protein